jgi:hypothetical protein
MLRFCKLFLRQMWFCAAIVPHALIVRLHFVIIGHASRPLVVKSNQHNLKICAVSPVLASWICKEWINGTQPRSVA